MDVDALLARYQAISQSEEEELLQRVFAAGWEAGCWLRVKDENLLIQTRGDADRVLDDLRSRDNFRLVLGNGDDSQGLDQTPITDDDPCFIVVTQKCDIVGLLRTEPFIELAPARFCADRGQIASRWKNSYREFPVDPDANTTFMVDLRHRYWLPKIDLSIHPVRQALPPNLPPNFVRFRFGLRLGQRYTRSAVPDPLVASVVGPLGDILDGDAEANGLFSEWMLYHGEHYPAERPHLVALYIAPDAVEPVSAEEVVRENELRIRAEDKFDDVVGQLVARSAGVERVLELDASPSGVYSDAEVPFATWRSSWKIDLDALTFGGGRGGVGVRPTR